MLMIDVRKAVKIEEAIMFPDPNFGDECWNCSHYNSAFPNDPCEWLDAPCRIERNLI